jgi:hypothetical protein
VGTGRVGNLNQLGNSSSAQQNPYNGLGVGGANGSSIPYAFPFAGVKFVTNLTTGSELGESVAPAIGVNGERGFILGAPGPHDPSTTTNGAGRAFLISGASALNGLSGSGTTVDLDTIGSQNISGLNVTTFVDSAAYAHFGRVGQSVAGAGDVIPDGNPEIAIGAPEATINGNTSAGAVYLVSGAVLRTGVQTIDLATVGQSGGTAGVVFGGHTAGDEAGWSVAAAGDVDGSRTSANVAVGDLLIGAPSRAAGNPGSAYLVYGSLGLPSEATTTGGLNYIDLSRLGVPTTSNTSIIAGLQILGASGGDQTGYAVSSAGDFNVDGLADIMVGSPNAGAGNGRVDLFYGQPAGSSLVLEGTITLGTNISFPNVSILGAGTELAGYSLSLVGSINGDKGNPILIGAPGFNASSGTVYILPQNPSQVEGTFSFTTVNSQPLAATQLIFTTPGTTTPAFFGASVGGILTQSGQTRTADGDLLADFIVGATGYQALRSGANRAGGALILEGAAIPLQTPTSGLTSLIGVDAPAAANTTYTVNPTSPAAMKIFVDSNAALNFAPVRDLGPTPVVTVNGVQFNGTLVADPKDENSDGIPDAIITISPRSNIGLTTSTTTLRVSARAIPSSPNAGQTWVGVASISVTSSSGGGGGGNGIASGLPVGFIAQTDFIPPFGPDVYVPSLTTLSTLSSYKPIPEAVALAQFGPAPGFAARIQQFYHPHLIRFGYTGGSGSRYGIGHNGHRTTTLGWKVFTREKYHPGKTFTFTHRSPVVPVNLQTEKFATNAASVRGVHKTR